MAPASRFLELPVEIRFLIYDKLQLRMPNKYKEFRLDYLTTLQFGANALAERRALACTCTKIRDEILEAPFGCTVSIHIAGTPYKDDSVRSLPDPSIMSLLERVHVDVGLWHVSVTKSNVALDKHIASLENVLARLKKPPHLKAFTFVIRARDLEPRFLADTRAARKMASNRIIDNKLSLKGVDREYAIEIVKLLKRMKIANDGKSYSLSE